MQPNNLRLAAATGSKIPVEISSKPVFAQFLSILAASKIRMIGCQNGKYERFHGMASFNRYRPLTDSQSKPDAISRD